MNKPKAHVVTATPTYTGDVCSEYANCLALAGMHCMLRNVWIDPRFAPGFSLVEYARNWLVAEFLSIKAATHLFWIDADLFFPPDGIYRMVARGKDVVAGVYTTKKEEDSTYPYTALSPEIDKLQEAERVPGGFLCMSRKAVEKVCEDVDWMDIEHNGVTRTSPRFFDLRLDGKNLIGEDFIACERLRKAGFKIYVETDLSFKHFGRKAWCGNLHQQLQREAESGFEGQGTVKAWEKNAKVAEDPALLDKIYKR